MIHGLVAMPMAWLLRGDLTLASGVVHGLVAMHMAR